MTSWTSALRLSERKATLPEIAKLLKVDYILEGSFLKTGDGFHVTVQCIRTADESHVWAEEFVAPWKDIFAMQKQVSEGVVRQSECPAKQHGTDERSPASRREITGPIRPTPRDTTTFSGMIPSSNRNTCKTRESLLKEAVQIDPDYSDALADLGRLCYLQLYPQRDDRMKMVAEGTTYLERALALDPENVEAHCWLAGIYGFVGLS